MTFRRSYERLAFDFVNANGLWRGWHWVPAPGYWRYRIVATVPADELDLWTDGVSSVDRVPDNHGARWMELEPGLNLDAITEWYASADGKQVVGIDRERRIVVYHLWTD